MIHRLRRERLIEDIFKYVIPTKVGIQNFLKKLDSGFRRNDKCGIFVNSLKLGVVCLLLVAIFCLQSCATSYDKRGVYHKVRFGDSIWQIARMYRVDVQQLAEYNNIMEPADVQPGVKLYIPPHSKKASYKQLPFGTSVASSSPRERGKYTRRKGGTDSYSKDIQLFRGRFDWPIAGRLSSMFGMRDGRRHDGVDLGAETGTPIKAADAGKVVFSGEMRGYGKLVLVRHEDDFFTAYAHNSQNKVKKDQMVKKGQVIAEVGRTGRASAPHLHFEIRHGQTARNPLFFLPARADIATKNAHAKK